jgi:hypothetical protein
MTPTLINLLQGRPFILRRLIGMRLLASWGGFPHPDKPRLTGLIRRTTPKIQ